MNQRVDPEPTWPGGTINPQHNMRRSFFLSLVGNRAYEVLQADCLPEHPNTKPIPELVDILRQKFEPPGRVPAYQLQFSQRYQKPNESAIDYIHALQRLAVRCEFGQYANMALLQQLRAGVRDPGVRRKLLAEAAITFDRAKDILIAEEALADQERALVRNPVTFNHVSQQSGQRQANGRPQQSSRGNRPHQSPNNARAPVQVPARTEKNPHVQQKSPPSRSSSSYQPKQFTKSCYRCGRFHDPATCPAREWKCYTCQRLGHVSTCCRSRQKVHNISAIPNPSPQVPAQEESRDDQMVNFLLHGNTYSVGHVFCEGPQVQSLVSEKSSVVSCVLEEISALSESWLELENEEGVLSDLFESESSVLPKQPSKSDLVPTVNDIVGQTIIEKSRSNVIIEKSESDVIIEKSESHVKPLEDNASVIQVKLSAQHVELPKDEVILYDEPRQLQSNMFPVCANVASPPECVTMFMNDKMVKMELDTGAGVSIMSQSSLSKCFPEVTTYPCDLNLSTINGPLVGVSQVMVSVKLQKESKVVMLPLVIAAGESPAIPLLGRLWLDQLFPEWRRSFCETLNQSVNSVCVNSEVEKLMAKFPRVFSTDNTQAIEGFAAKLHLKQDAKPVFARPYSIPYALVEVMDRKLDVWIAEGKLVPVSFSDWASPCLLVKKPNNDHRVVVDFKKTLNPQLNVDRCPPPLPADIFASMNGGKVFCVLDLTDAYTQLTVSPESQGLLVINTHRGLFKFTRLVYGVASAPGIFQSMTVKLLSGIPGVCAYLDDCLVKGDSFEDCRSKVEQVLERFNTHNVRLNLSKCK